MQAYKNSNLAIVPVKKQAKLNYKSRPQSLLKIILSSVGLLLIFALPAIACGKFSMSNIEFAQQLLFLPANLILYSYGIALVNLIFIEAYILSIRESIAYLKACGLTILAYIFYLLFSLVSAIFFIVPFPNYLIVFVILAAMCLSFCQRTSYLKNINQGMFTFLIYLFFIGLGFAHFFMVESISISAEHSFLYAVTGGILLIGFIFSFVVKGFAIGNFLREKRPTLAASVMSMQVGSFPILAIAYYLMKNLDLF
ncbi:hypothetical protein NIES2119_24815 [[Phormidium ambiguum] IAM M-71]|uniref:Uncharacterized protein n=1 Tax=[Phormidium ambiguum] IAM M-71 TaxID=454136 RepID=A0A1U7I903_9CYAN|nr:hypothetical protein [Phormidium ambiguum]OKH32960.1 hypothetical protein NIES2119_24815 [Phormidium ambiguum IAM M-71]